MAASVLTRTVLALAVSASMAAIPSIVQAGEEPPLSELSCSDLWATRNAIYANKGFCFKTARAKAMFGPRCYAPFGKLSKSEKKTVAKIKAIEASKGCPA